MKRQHPTQVKLLHKKFHFLNKTDISIIYDFCEEDPFKTEKVLTIVKDTRCPSSIIKTLLERPQKGQSLLASFMKRYDQQYSCRSTETLTPQKYPNQPKNLEFFCYTPKDIVLTMSLYLDIYSIISLTRTNKWFHSLHKSPLFEVYYRNLCINLFQKYIPKMPAQCRFKELQTFVLKRTAQFGPNMRRAVVNRLREFVWDRDFVCSAKMHKDSLIGFGGYSKLYYNLPRLHFNGLYSCIHHHRKQQQKNLLTNTGQVHLITYYRYMHFFEDGSVISSVHNHKQKIGYIAKILAGGGEEEREREREREERNVMIGEFVQEGRIVQVRMFKEGAIFIYRLEILGKGEDDARYVPCLSLVVKEYTLRVVDEKDIVQVLYTYDETNPIVFRYSRISAYAAANSGLIGGSSF